MGLKMDSEGLGIDLAKASSPAFLANDLVKIKNKTPVGHYRTPFYVRGKTGRIERILDEFINPEEEAYGKNVGSKVRLYRVSFAQQELWPEYHSASLDQLQIEISEHWLEPA
jgi:nitrile hydratase